MTEVGLGYTPIGVGIGIVGLQLESTVKVGDGLLKSTTLEIGNTPADVGCGDIGLQLESLVKFCDGVLVLTKVETVIALIEVRVDIVRPATSGDRSIRQSNRYEPTQYPDSAHQFR